MKTPGLWKGGEAKGAMPAMGAKLEIEEIERRETGENSQTPGCLAYSGRFRVLEPPEYKGRIVSEFFTIGTKEDKKARQEATWNRPEQGPGRLLKLLRVAGVPNSDDDDEWMEAAVGAKFLATVTTEIDRRNGAKQNRIGMYFEDGDKEFIGVGEELEAPGAANGRRGARGARSARGEEPRAATRERESEPDEDEAPPRSARGRKAADDEDEDRPRARSKRRDDDDE